MVGKIPMKNKIKLIISLFLSGVVLAQNPVPSTGTIVVNPITAVGIQNGKPIEIDPVLEHEWTIRENLLVSEDEYFIRESARPDYVTETEYIQREAARPPITPSPQDFGGTIIVRNETQLISALLVGGNILIPGIHIQLQKTLVPKIRGTTIRGLGLGNSKLSMATTAPGDRVLYPQAADLTISNITLSGGPSRKAGISMDGLSRIADRLTFDNVQIESVSWGIFLSGGPATNQEAILEDFTFRNSRIVDFSDGGIYLSWELLRPKIQDSYIWGNGATSSFNAVYLGMGIADAHISGCILGNTSRMALEVFFPYYVPNLLIVPGAAWVSKNYPNHPTINCTTSTFSNTGNFGASFATCKRGIFADLTASNTTNLGFEFVDEDLSMRSNYSVSNIQAFNSSATGIIIDRIRGGKFSNMLVDGVKETPSAHRGICVYLANEITLDNCTLTNCGPRYLLTIDSTRVNVTNSLFVAKPNESFINDPEGGNFAAYFYGGNVYFHNNIIRANTTNLLRTIRNNSTIMTSPSSTPISGYGIFVDSGNFRQ